MKPPQLPTKQVTSTRTVCVWEMRRTELRVAYSKMGHGRFTGVHVVSRFHGQFDTRDDSNCVLEGPEAPRMNDDSPDAGCDPSGAFFSFFPKAMAVAMVSPP